LGDYLRPVVSDSEIRHFYLVGPGNNILASDNSDYLGLTTPLTAFPHLMKQAWGGLAVITHPTRFMGQDHTAIYVAAAVKDSASQPVALLVFEVDPAVSFNQVFRKSAFSETGEAYAFNRDGVMLTPGRSNRVEVLPPVEDSGGTLLGELSDRRALEYQKTPLAAKIGNKSYEIYVRESFSGRDGEEKIGAWIWDSQFQMGLALEQSAEEGLKLLRKMQWTFLSFLGLVVLISLSFFFIISYWSATRSREEEHARQVLTEELQAMHESNTLEIADREAKHRAIIDTAWDAIFTVDSRGVILSGNPATTRIFGCQQDKLVGQLLEDSIWLEGRERMTAEYLASVSGQAIEATGIRSDLRTFPVTVSISQTQTSQASFFTVIVRDISEQKASEKSLLNAQNRLEMSQSFAFIGTWEWDVRSDQVTATEMALRLNGLDPDRSPVGLGIFFSRLLPEDRSELNQAIHASIASCEPFSIECRIESDLHHVEWLLIQGTPLQEQGAVNRIIGHVQRITERKANEKALLATRNMLRLVLDTIPIGVYWKGADLKIAGVNRKYCEDVELDE
ncbi:PAS domain S-box protein, partial [Oceanospirillum sp. HFRX-1_2]